MTDSEFSLKVMIKARDVADRASLSFHTDHEFYTDQMIGYLKELADIVKEYNNNKTGES
jgi:hypothetical protein|tara:strand:- start:105 stop:281 length:177 start_codon:yes stop_codon:yes gene_type:complete